MFETYDDAEVTLPKLIDKDDSRHWAYVYRRVHTPWFHVICRPADPKTDFSSRIFFFPNIGDLLALAGDTSAEIIEVSVVTPRRINGTDSWRMDRLQQIRVGWQSVRGIRMRSFFYALSDGRVLIDSSELVEHPELVDTEVLWPLQTTD
ncbi:MAG: hypothetical protein AB2598_18980 [Candidatus Thiodiazotropha sp.]